jgi:hypothetical protein
MSSPQWKCRNFEAIHNRMPGAEPELRVTGEIECPTPGYRLELRPHEPQGINPADLMLDLLATAPSGEVPQVVTWESVSYHEKTDFRYTSVSNMECGLAINVRDVS